MTTTDEIIQGSLPGMVLELPFLVILLLSSWTKLGSVSQEEDE